MKIIKFTLLFFGILALTSCSTIQVASDYDREVDFSSYNSFAFFKPGIDKAEVSDLDKKRILRAIERELTLKGMVKSTNPDLLVSIFTESTQNVNVYQNNFGWGWGWGWGWNPYFMGPGLNSVSTSVEGTLYIDLIDSDRNELVWQGLGTGILSLEMEEKVEKINEIVKEIMEEYPPERDLK
ncbi:DUF4136 domain-containing protein [Psychroflexus tropicus]|uniref:DUF4136 domain-containing protein n=1 Tax=Psychroflexus tropicus TaxID=197345 RepID=UPI00036038DA|nr:DUF4136 domain-containing protein [Psychroflexus tropicus]